MTIKIIYIYKKKNIVFSVIINIYNTLIKTIKTQKEV